MRRGFIALAALLALITPTAVTDGAPPGFFDRLVAQTDNLRPEVLKLAFEAYAEALTEGRVLRERLTVIDYSLPSYEKRLWVIDIPLAKVLFEEIVAHGMGSPRGSGGDMERATAFSNLFGSRKSSLGIFLTAETYLGRHGYTLKLDGLEQGINDNARERLIVVHGADYVTAARARDHMVGRSWGCPAVRPKIAHALIDAIKGGSALWIYYPDEEWLEASEYLDGE
jgi:hypothetical protein